MGNTLPWSLCRFCQWRKSGVLQWGINCKSTQICCCCYKTKAVTRAMLMWQDPVDWLGTGVGAGKKRLMQVKNLEGDPCSCITFQREGYTGKQLSSLLRGLFPTCLAGQWYLLTSLAFGSGVTLSAPAPSFESWVSAPGLCPRCEISSGNYKCGILGDGGELDRHFW